MGHRVIARRCGSHTLLQAYTRGLTDSGKGVCVGQPVDIAEVRVIAISDDEIPNWSGVTELPCGQIGEICVRGPQVTRSYFNRAESTQLAKIVDGDSFWHRMGDLGFIEDDGNLWFCGRKSHRVELSDGPLFTVPCELVFNTHPKVYRSALVGIQDGGQMQPVIVIETEGVMSLPEQDGLRQELLELAQTQEHTQVIQRVLFYDGFPVDIRHNAKINRPKWPEAQEQS